MLHSRDSSPSWTEVRGHHCPPWDLGMAPPTYFLPPGLPASRRADYLHRASALRGFLKDDIASDHFLKVSGSFLRSCQGRISNPGRHVGQGVPATPQSPLGGL